MIIWFDCNALQHFAKLPKREYIEVGIISFVIDLILAALLSSKAQ